jgi:hypothetical protein
MSDKMLDELADAFERGEWPGSRTVLLGRPRLAEEEVKPVTFRLPVSHIQAIDAAAKKAGESRSEFLREAVEKALASA